ncbi:hypothetical protein PICMEDRAFT_14976 [Pichia membranifaciens NRRL Y-2026]|uniref:SET domain-containing protein n=1 Tax=Pichia membranifaciens NRRL Y-2026 TaxID=763406 RepID=A0A1E3NTY3_9ASCO|nr:hypothetical protein PICMEDRAFT_14976 [Pichia membranifaciens NRRL Y-2026]ODQ49542.1 hypothetical protein PICMEDRAFT_14976 [Pichia membranifaciens NRRL Y-2026]
MTEKLQALLEWARSNGLYVNEKLTFKDTAEHGTSCIIAQPLEEQDKTGLIKVPKELLITPILADAFASKYLKGVNTSTSKNANSNLLFLLAKLKFDKTNRTVFQESNVDLSEQFKPYLDYLPDTGKALGNPYFWTMEEKEMLDGTDAYTFMKRDFLKDLEDWKKIVLQMDIAEHPQLKDELLEYEAFKMGPVGGVAVDYLLNIKEVSWTSFTAYLWASCVVSSRAFPYILFDQSSQYKSQAFLLPIVDLLNSADDNQSKCRWTIEDNQFVFSTLDDLSKLRKNCELYNNYGDKSNLSFLLHYGFCLKNNDNESTTLTLKLDPSVIEGAKNYGVIIPKDSTEEVINFELRKNSPLSKDLINFFAYLVKLRSEKTGFTVRMKLEGSTQLRSIIKTKLKTLKKVDVVMSENVSEVNAKNIKLYRKSQKDIFQKYLEQIEQFEKQLLTEFKPFSFKKALQADKAFFNSFLLVFGTRTYNDLIEKGILDHAVLLWIMRIANKNIYTDIPDTSIFPEFIYNEFEKVKNSTEIDSEDIAEYLPMYQSLFPALCEKIPIVYNHGDWTLNNLIYAGTVADRLTYKRETNGEVFFIDPSRSN